MGQSEGAGAVYEVRLHSDLEYAVARVGYNDGEGPMADRPLKLDWYEPLGFAGPRPGIVMAFGGAFHRGSKEDDVRPEEVPRNTNIADYCRWFAEAGFPSFSIDYRLTQEDPHPGYTPTLADDKVPTSRIDVVRKLLGLPPATEQMLRNEQEAAVDDIVSAYRYVAGNAAAFGVDPARLAIGGYSAGGRIACVAAMAEAISPAAVIGLSGVPTAGVLKRYLASDPRQERQPPVFVAYGEHDLDYVIPGARALVSELQRTGHPHEAFELPGQTHFYPADAPVRAAGNEGDTLLDRLMAFLRTHLDT